MKFKYFAYLLIVLISVAACRQSEPENSSGLYPAIGEHMRMPSFEMVSLTDKQIVNSRQFEGQVLLVTFFATWCPPCIQEIPTLMALQDSYREKGFSVIAFSVDEGDTAPVVNLISRYGINYPVFYHDPSITKSFGGVTGIPVSFLVNRQGEIVKKYLGYASQATLEEEIRDLLAAG